MSGTFFWPAALKFIGAICGKNAFQYGLNRRSPRAQRRQLLSPRPPRPSVQCLEYDGLGRRIGKDHSSSNATNHYYYNEQWQQLEERKEVSGAEDPDPLSQYVWHPYYIDALAVRYYDANTSGTQVRHWYQQDANYNVTAVIDDTGAPLERYSYTPYGEVTFLDQYFAQLSTQVSAIGNTHLYTGRERDPETGLQLNRHRYYASWLGRWLTRDPIGYDGSDSSSKFSFTGARRCKVLSRHALGVVFRERSSPACV